MLQFASCTFDVDARQLCRDGHEVQLSPKAFELLRVLIESRPRALSKSELLERVWPDTFVSEASLTRTVNEIRNAIGEPGRIGSAVRTVHGYGYAFAAPVGAAGFTSRSPEAATPVAWLANAQQEIALHEGVHLAGRDAAAQIRLDSPRVSRRHARFNVDGTRVIVEDLKSKNGTIVNGQRIVGAVTLRHGDSVTIGPVTLTVCTAAAGASTETEVQGTPTRPTPSR